MTPEKIREVCDLMWTALQRDFGCRGEARRYSDADQGIPMSQFDLAAHCMWMTQEVPTFVDAGRREKAMRWLGFVQGAGLGLGCWTLTDVKRWNAPNGVTFDTERL